MLATLFGFICAAIVAGWYFHAQQLKSERACEGARTLEGYAYVSEVVEYFAGVLLKLVFPGGERDIFVRAGRKDYISLLGAQGKYVCLEVGQPKGVHKTKTSDLTAHLTFTVLDRRPHDSFERLMWDINSKLALSNSEVSGDEMDGLIVDLRSNFQGITLNDLEVLRLYMWVEEWKTYYTRNQALPAIFGEWGWQFKFEQVAPLVKPLAATE